MMGAARYGLRLDLEHIWSSVVPSSRELVNLCTLNVKRIFVGNIKMARDPESFKAQEILEKNKILMMEELKRG
jgi:hypothetical protein